MTCIVGIKSGEKVLIAGDSAGVSGLDIVVRRDRKVFGEAGFAIGGTTSFRMLQILQYGLPFDHLAADSGELDLHRFMATRFVDACRDAMAKGGFKSTDSGVEKGGTFLVGFRGRLFRIEEDFQVGESDDLFDAVGCGASYALGSLQESRGSALSPDQRAIGALECAAHFSAGVRAPFHTMLSN